MKKSLRVMLVAAVSAVSVTAISPFAYAANQGTAISRYETMHKGDYLHRDMTGYAIELIMQGDGNLVLKATNGHICWASHTVGGDHAAYQWDGNFVIYNSSGKAMWASNTTDGGSGESGQTVDISTDGTYRVGYKKIAKCTL